jgi:hypothetical protein
VLTCGFAPTVVAPAVVVVVGVLGQDGLQVPRAEDQQLEVPLVTARRVQHDLHRARCGCGEVHVAARPAGVPDSAVSIGPNVRALAVYLLVYQQVPIGRRVRLIADVTGAQVSAGFIHSCLAGAAGVIADVVKLIKTVITAAAVAGFDETTLRCGPAGTRKYVLAAVTELYSLFFLGRRTLKSFAEFGTCPRPAAWWSPTGTRTTSTTAGSTSLGTGHAWRI